MNTPERVYIGLGSNQEGPVSQIVKALVELTRLPDTRLLAASDLYRTPPMGPQDQPWFVNAVAVVTTSLQPQRLLEQTQAIERRMGRTFSHRWGPRIIDIDLLLYGEQTLVTESLRIPHPGLRERNFVLLPLASLAPDLRLPCGTAVADLAENIGLGRMERI